MMEPTQAEMTVAVSTTGNPNNLTYHVRLDIGPDRVAEADIRRSGSSIELIVDITAGHHPREVRSRLIDAVFDIDVMKKPFALSATLPEGDVDLLTAVTAHCTDVRVRAAGHSCLIDGVIAE